MARGLRKWCLILFISWERASLEETGKGPIALRWGRSFVLKNLGRVALREIRKRSWGESGFRLSSDCDGKSLEGIERYSGPFWVTSSLVLIQAMLHLARVSHAFAQDHLCMACLREDLLTHREWAWLTLVIMANCVPIFCHLCYYQQLWRLNIYIVWLLLFQCGRCTWYLSIIYVFI